MRILSIDPGPERSAWVWLEDGFPSAPYDGLVPFGECDNSGLMSAIRYANDRLFPVAIEDFVPYGQRFGWDTRNTLLWIGRFDANETAHLIPRPDIRLHLCGQKSGVGDPDIRQALIRRFGPSKREAIGLKASPGPLYGFRSHLWSALAVAVTYYDQKEGG